MKVSTMMISVGRGTFEDTKASTALVGQIKKSTNAGPIGTLRTLRDSSTAAAHMLSVNRTARLATAEPSAQTRTKGSMVLISGFPTPVANASEADMARIKQYVSQLGDRYGLSEQEMEAVTLALACHPGQSLNAEIAMVDRILSLAESFPDRGAKSQAARVLLTTYGSLTPARAGRPERFPQVLVESLTQWGFSPFPGEYRWTAHEKPVEVARILANTTDSAFNSLMRVIGPWEPASWRTFGLILLDERSLMGFGVISPAESAWNIAEAVTKGKPY